MTDTIEQEVFAHIRACKKAAADADDAWHVARGAYETARVALKAAILADIRSAGDLAARLDVGNQRWDLMAERHAADAEQTGPLRQQAIADARAAYAHFVVVNQALSLAQQALAKVRSVEI